MRFILAVDGAMTMTLQPNGEPPLSGATSRYEVATHIVAGLVRRAKKMVPEPIITLYRSGATLEKLCDDVSDDSTAVELLERRCALGESSNIEALLHKITTDLQPTFDDHIICFTDACRYEEGSDNFFALCETRFVVVNTNREEIDELQIDELEEVSAESCGYEVSPENVEFYHLFYYNATAEDIVEKISNEMFISPIYKLKFGNLEGIITTSPPTWEDAPFEIEVVGFCKSLDMSNASVDSEHHIIPQHPKQGTSEVANDARHSQTINFIMECMTSDISAVCRFGSGRHGLISSTVTENERYLNLSLLALSQSIPPLQQLQLDDIANAYRNIILGLEANYIANAQSSSNDNGIANDIRKIIGHLKELPEQKQQFYQEVNKLRYYAKVINNNLICEETARLIVNEAKDLNETAQRHAEYAAGKLRINICVDNGTADDIVPLEV